MAWDRYCAASVRPRYAASSSGSSASPVALSERTIFQRKFHRDFPRILNGYPMSVNTFFAIDDFNPATGSLTNEQQVSSLPPGFAGTVFTSEIRVSADGRFVYGVNRLNDTIGVFRIGHDGRLTQVSHASTLGDYPRTFVIDPSGRFMAIGNQRADNVTTFRISREDDAVSGQFNVPGESNRGNGSLTFTGNYTPVGSPSGMVFLI